MTDNAKDDNEYIAGFHCEMRDGKPSGRVRIHHLDGRFEWLTEEEAAARRVVLNFRKVDEYYRAQRLVPPGFTAEQVKDAVKDTLDDWAASRNPFDASVTADIADDVVEVLYSRTATPFQKGEGE